MRSREERRVWNKQGVTLVRAMNPGAFTLQGTNSWVVGAPAWIVDPGPADPDHIERVDVVARCRGGAAGILLTHRHTDHAAAAPLLAERLSVPVFAGPERDDPEGFSEPSTAGLELERELHEGDTVGPFAVIETPGHSADHVSFVREGSAFCGDTVLGEGSVFIPPGGGSLAAYLDSLRRLRELDLDVLCPGHGPLVQDARAKLDEYIEHRLDRERRLVDALDRGLRTRDELLDDVWDDAPPALRMPAALTLEAHLDKLEGEGRLPAGVERGLPAP
jgi:glyoxylase-like metal-dependent hydrolase (beta-lactamase superfamily II)